jgi:cupin fold WbuC family metalloprotein
METRHFNDAVYVADDTIVRVTRRDIARLKELAAGTKRRRVRLCAHRDTHDALHEMLIVLDSATYVRPHRHRNKSESFHVIEGMLTVVVFHEDGRVRATIPLGDYASARPFFYRLGEPSFHTVLVESANVVIHETTNGPFNRVDTEFAPWSPPEDDEKAGRRYLRELSRCLGGGANRT